MDEARESETVPGLRLHGEASVAETLSTRLAELLDEARAVRARAHCPYSGFHVGAAVLMDGEISAGCNFENASYGGTICAERNAIGSGIAAGRRRLEAVAISTDAAARPDLESRAPCGLCRQVMAEFADDDTLVLLDAGDRYGDGRSIDALLFREIFPLRFRLGDG